VASRAAWSPQPNTLPSLPRQGPTPFHHCPARAQHPSITAPPGPNTLPSLPRQGPTPFHHCPTRVHQMAITLHTQHTTAAPVVPQLLHNCPPPHYADAMRWIMGARVHLGSGANAKQPASTDRPPASTDRPPTSTDRPPASADRSPASAGRPTASADRPPARLTSVLPSPLSPSRRTSAIITMFISHRRSSRQVPSGGLRGHHHRSTSSCDGYLALCPPPPPPNETALP